METSTVYAVQNPYTGEQMYHIRSVDGCPWPYIYKQKQSVDYKTWVQRVARRLFKAKYDKDAISDVVRACTGTRCYFNNYYYVPPYAIAQRVMELGIDWFLEEIGVQECSYNITK